VKTPATWLGPALLVLAAGAYLWPLTGRGAWIAGDSPFHLAVAHAVRENLVAGQGLMAWSHHDLGGFPVLSLFVPGILGVLAVVGAGALAGAPLDAAYKALVGAAVVLPPLAVWAALVRPLGAALALIVANLALLLTYHVVQPLAGAWGVYLAAAFVALAGVSSEPWLRDGPRVGRAVALAVPSAAAVLSDSSAWTALPCMALAQGVVHGRGAGAGRLAAWALLLLGPLVVWVSVLTVSAGTAWGLAGGAAPLAPAAVASRLPAWFVLPGSGEVMVKDVRPALDAGNWGEAALVVGRVLLEHAPEMAVVALALGGAVLVVRRPAPVPVSFRRIAGAHAVAAGLLLAAILLPRGGAASAWLAAPERLVPYVNLALLALGAATLGAVGARLGSVRARRVAVVVALGLVGAHAVRLATYGEHVLLKTADRSVVHQELDDVWRFLRASVATPTRVVYETLDGVGFLDGGTARLAALSAVTTGLPALATWRGPALGSVRRPPILGAAYPLRSLDALPEILRRWNSGYLVVWWPGTRERLRDSGAYEIVHESPNRLFAVLRWRDWQPSWLEFARPVGRRGEGPLSAGGPLRFVVDNPWPDNRAVLKMTWHPGWRLRVNGLPTELAAVGGQIGTGALPAGPLELAFVFGGRG
jgi:hypothetical protein